MRRRIDVDDTLPPVAVPGRVLNEVFAHALETLPEECCGLVLGDDQQRFRSVARCRNEMTQMHQRDPRAHPRDGREAFYMNELDYQRVSERAQARGERVTVVYHSHVDAGPYLSEMDLEYAQHAFFPFPDSDQLVVAVHDGKVRGSGLFRRAGQDAFEGRSIVAVGP